MNVTINLRQLVIALMIVVVLSTAIGFLISTVTSAQYADAARTQLVADRLNQKELKRILQELYRLNESIGDHKYDKGLRGELREALGNPEDKFSLKDYIKDICLNTRNIPSEYRCDVPADQK